MSIIEWFSAHMLKRNCLRQFPVLIVCIVAICQLISKQLSSIQTPAASDAFVSDISIDGAFAGVYSALLLQPLSQSLLSVQYDKRSTSLDMAWWTGTMVLVSALRASDLIYIPLGWAGTNGQGDVIPALPIPVLLLTCYTFMGSLLAQQIYDSTIARHQQGRGLAQEEGHGGVQLRPNRRMQPTSCRNCGKAMPADKLGCDRCLYKVRWAANTISAVRSLLLALILTFPHPVAAPVLSVLAYLTTVAGWLSSTRMMPVVMDLGLMERGIIVAHGAVGAALPAVLCVSATMPRTSSGAGSAIVVALLHVQVAISVLGGQLYTSHTSWAYEVLESARKQSEHARKALQAQKDLVAAQKQAELSHERFQRAVFHELRSPFNSMHLGVELMLDQARLLAALAAVDEDGAGSASSTDGALQHSASAGDLSALDTLSMMSNAAAAAKVILDDTFDQGTNETGSFSIQMEPVALGPVLKSVMDALRPQATGSGVQLHLHVDPALPGLVLADQTRLQQLVANLTSNAIKFSTSSISNGQGVADGHTNGRPVEQGHVWVSLSAVPAGTSADQLYGGVVWAGSAARTDDSSGTVTGSSFIVPGDATGLSAPFPDASIILVDPSMSGNGSKDSFLGSGPAVCTVVLTVQDSGPGISREEAGSLFTPFTQLEAGHTNSTRGTGLGLVICKDIVRQHGGRIGVCPRPDGQGPPIDGYTPLSAAAVAAKSNGVPSLFTSRRGRTTGMMAGGTSLAPLRAAAAGAHASSGARFATGARFVTVLPLTITSRADSVDSSRSRRGDSKSSGSRTEADAVAGPVRPSTASTTTSVTFVEATSAASLAPARPTASSADQTGAMAGSSGHATANGSRGGGKLTPRVGLDTDTAKSVPVEQSSDSTGASATIHDDATASLRWRPGCGRPLRILVVDDVLHNRKLLARALGTKLRTVLQAARAAAGDAADADGAADSLPGSTTGDAGPRDVAGTPTAAGIISNGAPGQPPQGATGQATLSPDPVVEIDMAEDGHIAVAMATGMEAEEALTRAAVLPPPVPGKPAHGANSARTRDMAHAGFASRYDAITMDAEMPALHGFAATRLIRAAGFTGPIFGCTGNAVEADRRLFVAAGVNRVFFKPVDVGQVAEAILQAL